jgi:hypothetical protein
MYTFFSWHRDGIAGRIDRPDTLTESLPGSVGLRAGIRVNFDLGAAAGVTATVRGPGHVTGFSTENGGGTSLVIRRQPEHLTPDFEPNYFVALELRPPGFPWLFTPASANADDQLRPWISLVVIERGEDSSKLQPGTPLPTISIADAEAELPDPPDSWAWAHLQMAAGRSADSSPEKLLETRPELFSARLLCPRRLEPDRAYHACVVPTFMAGRQAGLGEQVRATDLTYAWKRTDKNFSLPVYLHWEFATGPAGDFEALAKLLKAQPLPEGVGKRDLDVSAPGGGLGEEPPEGERVKLGLEGALRTPGAKPTRWPKGKRQPFVSALRRLLNAPARRSADDARALLAPPIYGCWHAARLTVPGKWPNWLRELNLDPRRRVYAALGTKVVQDEQEDLAAAAWAQVGELKSANQLLRQAQLARQAGLSMYARHFADRQPGRLLQLTGPLQARVRSGPVTVRARLTDSCLPNAVLGPAFRRLLRPRGPLARHAGLDPAGAAAVREHLIARLATGALTVAPPRAAPEGTVTVDGVSAAHPPSEGRRFEALSESAVREAPRQTFRLLADDAPVRPTRPSQTDSDAAAEFRAAAAVHQAELIDTVSVPAAEPCPEFPVESTAAALREALDPQVTVPKRLERRIGFALGPWEHDDPLEPIMAAPEFPAPMYTALRELSQEWLLPGLDKVPRNSMTVLESNPHFIEAYMVGLNHEMGRELLWRGFPTDQRGTYFRQFWNVSAVVPQPADEQARERLKDIHPIHRWPPEKHLGDREAADAAREAQLVLLIRADLLTRYPGALIYAVPAVWSGSKRQPSLDKALERYPLFRGTLEPDVVFAGFADLTESQARGTTAPPGDPGWFFVIQQPLSEPRFGLDASTGYLAADPTRWGDLAWGHLASNDADYKTLSRAPVAGSRPQAWGFDDAPGIKWGAKGQAAHIAHISLRRPVRIAVHADDMLASP